jgi:hypothetical protein
LEAGSAGVAFVKQIFLTQRRKVAKFLGFFIARIRTKGWSYKIFAALRPGDFALSFGCLVATLLIQSAFVMISSILPLPLSSEGLYNLIYDGS